MFTGIVEEVGIVTRIQRGTKSASIEIAGKVIFDDISIGDSVAVNGACLTVTSIGNHSFTADVMHETLRCSTLRELKSQSKVNLERAMCANGRFGGHMVSGHIDGTGIIKRIKKDDNAILYTIEAEEDILHYIVSKGSIAIDGISLTVVYVMEKEFQVSVIPHTTSATTLAARKEGNAVNLENDMIGKYVEKMMNQQRKVNTNRNGVCSITRELLEQAGY